MKTKQSFSILARWRSILYATEGVSSFFRNQHNAIIHLLATAIVFMAALFFGVSKTEIIALVIVTGFVWVSEIFNTAIETIMDHLSPEQHPKVKYIKDVAAAAVLVAAITAVVTGALIFIPKLF
jgi:diacylglycerol kinase (ATP)